MTTRALQRRLGPCNRVLLLFNPQVRLYRANENDAVEKTQVLYGQR